MNVLDCVLSLNRRYDAFVVPRLEAFADRHPEVVGLVGLRRMICRYRTPRAFCMAELNYDHAARADTILKVTTFLINAQKRHSGNTEAIRIRAWARAARPSDSKGLGIDGFGLAGFQYMRMLFGAHTTKPDRHIVRFVSHVIGRRVSPVVALQLLEDASRDVKIPVRDLDYAIWKAAARKDVQDSPA
jgi:hypothetical protein